MPFDAGSIFGTLDLNISPFAAGINEASSIARVFPTTVQNFIASPLLGVIGIAKQASNALLDIFRSATNAADDANDLAHALGVDVEQLTALGAVAESNKSNLNGVAEAVKFLNRNAADASQGNKDLAGTFARLGISMDDLQKSDPIDLLLRVGDAINALPSPMLRTQAAMTLLGRAGDDLLPTLQNGSAALRLQMQDVINLGAATSAAAGKSADEWNDAMAEASLAWRGFKNTAAGAIRDTLLPLIQELTARLSDFMPILTAIGNHPWLTLMIATLPTAINLIANLTKSFVILTAAIEAATAAEVALKAAQLAVALGASGAIGIATGRAAGMQNDISSGLGGVAGGALGAAAGSFFGPAGTAFGLAAGSAAGGYLGGKAYDYYQQRTQVNVELNVQAHPGDIANEVGKQVSKPLAEELHRTQSQAKSAATAQRIKQNFFNVGF